MDYSIQDLPQEDRPREKLEKKGASSLSDTELLSIVLRTGIKGKNVKELSAEILSDYSLAALGDADLEDLKSFEGVSRVKAGQLKALGELSRRTELEERETIESLSDVKARTGDMRYMSEEVLRVFYLSSGNEILAEKEHDGGPGSVSVSVKEILRDGLKRDATALIMTHNHPSQNPEPTEQDLKFTEEVVEGAEKVGMRLLDHVIVGEDYHSLRESRKMDLGG